MYCPAAWRALTPDGVEEALKRFEKARKPRTSRIQLTSRNNTWMRRQTNPDWVYGYDAWNVDLDAVEVEPAPEPSPV